MLRPRRAKGYVEHDSPNPGAELRAFQAKAAANASAAAAAACKDALARAAAGAVACARTMQTLGTRCEYRR